MRRLNELTLSLLMKCLQIIGVNEHSLKQNLVSSKPPAWHYLKEVSSSNMLWKYEKKLSLF